MTFRTVAWLLQLGAGLSFGCGANNMPAPRAIDAPSNATIELDQGVCVVSAIHDQARTRLTHVCGPWTTALPQGVTDLLVRWYFPVYRGEALPLFSLQLSAASGARYRLSATDWQQVTTHPCSTSTSDSNAGRTIFAPTTLVLTTTARNTTTMARLQAASSSDLRRHEDQDPTHAPLCQLELPTSSPTSDCAFVSSNAWEGASSHVPAVTPWPVPTDEERLRIEQVEAMRLRAWQGIVNSAKQIYEDALHYFDERDYEKARRASKKLRTCRRFSVKERRSSYPDPMVIGNMRKMH
jgi:hypothetical protein